MRWRAHRSWFRVYWPETTLPCVATLARLPNLEGLYLDDTQVTPAGLARLAGLPKLQFVSVNGAKIPAAALKGF